MKLIELRFVHRQRQRLSDQNMFSTNKLGELSPFWGISTVVNSFSTILTWQIKENQ